MREGSEREENMKGGKMRAKRREVKAAERIREKAKMDGNEMRNECEEEKKGQEGRSRKSGVKNFNGGRPQKGMEKK